MHDHLLAEPLRLDYEDFCALPEDGRRYEILDGDLFMSPSPGTPHQRVLGRLFRMLSDHVETRGLGEVFIAPFDVLLNEHDIVEPDLIFVSTANSGIVTEKHIRGVPDLLVEVVSLSKPEYDTHAKRAVYARCGVPWYWIIDPAGRTLLELKLESAAYRATAECRQDEVFVPQYFPQLRIRLAAIWP